MGVFHRLLSLQLGLGLQNTCRHPLHAHLARRTRKSLHSRRQPSENNRRDLRNEGVLHCSVREALQPILRARVHPTLGQLLRIRSAPRTVNLLDRVQLPDKPVVDWNLRVVHPRLQ